MNTTYEGLGLKYLHTEVVEMLKIAAGYGGEAFGGYVRDVVTKIRCNDFSPTKVKDVDIWFKTEKDRDQFVTVCNKLIPSEYCNGIARSDGFGVVQHILQDRYGDPLIWVDTVVSSVFPVWDLSVNFLVYDSLTETIYFVEMYG